MNIYSFCYLKKNRIIIALLAVILMSLPACELDDIDSRDKFIGKWRVSESSEYYGPPAMSYTVDIKEGELDEDEIIISNFYNMNVDAYAFVSGNNITIPRQLICDDTIEIEGSGNYTNNEIHLSYSANDGAVLDNLTAILTKP